MGFIGFKRSLGVSRGLFCAIYRGFFSAYLWFIPPKKAHQMQLKWLFTATFYFFLKKPALSLVLYNAFSFFLFFIFVKILFLKNKFMYKTKGVIFCVFSVSQMSLLSRIVLN